LVVEEQVALTVAAVATIKEDTAAGLLLIIVPLAGLE
jgi:hypothetical protein